MIFQEDFLFNIDVRWSCMRNMVLELWFILEHSKAVCWVGLKSIYLHDVNKFGLCLMCRVARLNCIMSAYPANQKWLCTTVNSFPQTVTAKEKDASTFSYAWKFWDGFNSFLCLLSWEFCWNLTTHKPTSFPQAVLSSSMRFILQDPGPMHTPSLKLSGKKQTNKKNNQTNKIPK